MKRTSVYAGQELSHARQANLAGMSHDGEYETEVTVGVTPRQDQQGVVAHGCSSRMKILKVRRPGDGHPVPERDTYRTQYPDGLPAVTGNVILRAKMVVTPNGALTLRQPTDVRVVPVPANLQAPWAYDGGAEDVAEAYGCRDLDEMFAKHGQAVVV